MWPKFRSKYRRKKFYKGWAYSFIAWCVCIGLFFMIKLDSIQTCVTHYQDYEYYLGPVHFISAIITTIIISFFFSTISWNIYFFIEESKHFSLLQRMIFDSTVFMACFYFLYYVINIAGNWLYENGHVIQQEIPSRLIVILMIYSTVVGFFINAIFQLKDLLGPELFRSIIKGNYYVPKEEDRIFMFLDLNNSTTIAEQLGHTDYSRFIKNVFKTITDPIANNDANIYQYIGDEVVLTWPTEEGVIDNKCVITFFQIQRALQEQATFFKEKFGVIPSFKAGLHTGVVSTIQIGIMKKEIAHHGDAVNATARIQSQCNELGVSLLISGKLKNKLTMELEPLVEMKLKGRRNLTKLYTTI